MLKKYSSRHILLLLWFTVQAFFLGVFLHNAIYALGILSFGTNFWGVGGDEPVFFIIATLVVPAGFIVGLVGRVWEWAVIKPVQEMEASGFQLPGDWWYFVPLVCYGWLWKFGEGIERITERRMQAAGVFALVFFLGVIGLMINRALIGRRLSVADV